jgi:NAD-dependent deacetylase
MDFTKWAGSKNVIELHGSIHRNYCVNCGKSFSLDYVMSSDSVPHCDRCGGIIKPDVVLYEEPLNENDITKALIAIQSADLLIVAGTSLNVYPAAGLINYFYGDNIAVINKEDILTSKNIKLKIKSPIGEVFSKLSDIL